MPENLIGAHVPVFVSAADHEAAAFAAVLKLTSQGFECVDITDGMIHELDPLKWDAFVVEAWAEFENFFPKQAQVVGELDYGFCFVGPFSSY